MFDIKPILKTKSLFTDRDNGMGDIFIRCSRAADLRVACPLYTDHYLPYR